MPSRALSSTMSPAFGLLGNYDADPDVVYTAPESPFPVGRHREELKAPKQSLPLTRRPRFPFKSSNRPLAPKPRPPPSTTTPRECSSAPPTLAETGPHPFWRAPYLSSAAPGYVEPYCRLCGSVDPTASPIRAPASRKTGSARHDATRTRRLSEAGEESLPRPSAAPRGPPLKHLSAGTPVRPSVRKPRT